MPVQDRASGANALKLGRTGELARQCEFGTLPHRKNPGLVSMAKTMYPSAIKKRIAALQNRILMVVQIMVISPGNLRKVRFGSRILDADICRDRPK